MNDTGHLNLFLSLSTNITAVYTFPPSSLKWHMKTQSGSYATKLFNLRRELENQSSKPHRLKQTFKCVRPEFSRERRGSVGGADLSLTQTTSASLQCEKLYLRSLRQLKKRQGNATAPQTRARVPITSLPTLPGSATAPRWLLGG